MRPIVAVEVTESKRTKVVIFGLSAFVCVAVALVLALVPEQTHGAGPSALATLNASLNATAGCLLVLGYIFH